LWENAATWWSKLMPPFFSVAELEISNQNRDSTFQPTKWGCLRMTADLQAWVKQLLRFRSQHAVNIFQGPQHSQA
jgi:hypothetical protein